jgi:hypothetical protein
LAKFKFITSRVP